METKLDHLTLLPEVKVGTIFGQKHETGLLEYGKVTKIICGSLVHLTHIDHDVMLVYYDAIRILKNTFTFVSGEWTKEDYLKRALECGELAILPDDEWYKLKTQAAMAMSGLKARMEQAIESARKKPTPPINE